MQLDTQIGAGTYGVVYKGKDSKGQTCAIKCFKVDTTTEGIDVGILRELAYLKSLPTHQNIIRLGEVEWIDNRLRVTMPLYKYDLNNYIKNDKKGAPLNYDEVVALCGHILRGLHHLHVHGIFHRDIKSSNILLDGLGCAVICDFSLASNFVAKIEHSTTVQTLWYRATEILLGSTTYNTAVDMWSFGCVLGFMMRGHDIMMGDCEYGQLVKIFAMIGTPDEALYPGISTLPNFSTTWPKFAQRNMAEEFPQFANCANLIKVLNSSLVHDPKNRTTATLALEQLGVRSFVASDNTF